MAAEVLLTPQRPSEPACYTVYGLTFATAMELRAPLVRAEPPAELELRLVDRAPAGPAFDDAETVYTSGVLNDRGESRFELRRAGEREILRFTGEADFYLDRRAIAAHPLSELGRLEVESTLLSSVFAYWLERRGVPVLHASAVSVEGRAVALLGRSGSGKSSLAAALMLAGAELLTDDVLAVESSRGGLRARPGYPQLKLAPEAGRALLGDRFDRLPLVDRERFRRSVVIGDDGPGRFCRHPRELAACYLPQRDPGAAAPRSEPLGRRDAVVELVRHAFIPRLLEGSRLDAGRLDALAALTGRVPLRRLRYEWSAGSLEAAAAAVLADLDAGVV